MKIGLTLSGGGARGIAHLGILKALEEKGLKPEMISGVSSGAIVGALYAAGLKPEQILATLMKPRMFKYFRPAWSKFGLLNMQRLIPIYKLYLPCLTFEELQIKLIISAADLKEGKTIYFDSGNLIEPILASACIPLLFAPFVYGEKRLVDGGVINNLPVEPLIGKVDFLIGAHVNPNNPNFEVTSIKSMVERTFNLAVGCNVKPRKDYCDLVIEPQALCKYRIFDIGKAEEIFNIGYESAIEAICKNEKIESFLGQKSQ